MDVLENNVYEVQGLRMESTLSTAKGVGAVTQEIRTYTE